MSDIQIPEELRDTEDRYPMKVKISGPAGYVHDRIMQDLLEMCGFEVEIQYTGLDMENHHHMLTVDEAIEHVETFEDRYGYKLKVIIESEHLPWGG